MEVMQQAIVNSGAKEIDEEGKATVTNPPTSLPPSERVAKRMWRPSDHSGLWLSCHDLKDISGPTSIRELGFLSKVLARRERVSLLV